MLFGLLSLGCERQVTQLLVVLDSGVAAAEFRRIELGTDEDRAGLPVDPPGPIELPLSFGVEPRGGDAGRRASITVRAELDAGAFIETSARVGFIEERALELPMFLARRCIDVECPARTRCDGATAQCVDNAVDENTLGDADPSRDPREPIDGGPVDADSSDAGPVDAGPVDAGPIEAGPVDAGQDASVPLGTLPLDVDFGMGGAIDDAEGIPGPQAIVYDDVNSILHWGYPVEGPQARVQSIGTSGTPELMEPPVSDVVFADVATDEDNPAPIIL